MYCFSLKMYCRSDILVLLIITLIQIVRLTQSTPVPGVFDFFTDQVSSVANAVTTFYNSTVNVLEDTSAVFQNARKAFTERSLAGIGMFASTTDNFRKRESSIKKAFNQFGGVAHRNSSDVRFLLYANKFNSSDPDELTIENIACSKYNATLPLLLIAHGFKSNIKRQNSSINIIKLAYFNANYFATLANVVLVDWSAVCTTCESAQGLDLWNSYVETASYVNAVADKVTGFLLKLDALSLLSTSENNVTDAHFVGHSLGAHLLGFAAQYYTTATGKKIRRLTGTDPAGPLYNNKPQTERFNPEQAVFVDAVHTNAGQSGILGNVATVDFYVNGGGMFQPECVDRGAYFQVDRLRGCSHRLAAVYFALSISNQTIEATCSGKCNFETIVFGQGVSTNATGQYNVVI